MYSKLVEIDNSKRGTLARAVDHNVRYGVAQRVLLVFFNDVTIEDARGNMGSGPVNNIGY